MKYLGKKIMALVLGLLLVVTLLAGCGAHQCYLCGQTKSCKKAEVLGENVYVCNDCIKDIKDMMGG